MTSLGLNAGSLSGDIFSNNLINGAFEIAARIVTPFLLEWKVFGRRNSLILMFFICGASCLLSLVLKEFSDCVPIQSGNCFDDETILPSCNQAMIDASKVQINSRLKYEMNNEILKVYGLCRKVCRRCDIFCSLCLFCRVVSHMCSCISCWNLFFRLIYLV